MFEKRIDFLKTLDEEELKIEKDEFEFFDEKDNKNDHIDQLLKTMGPEMSDVQSTDPLDKEIFNPTAKSIWNIYFYIGDIKKIEKANGIQFINDRFIKKFKEYTKFLKHNNEEVEINLNLRNSILEESKSSYSEDINNDIEVKKMKFEKFMLLLLFGSCDLTHTYSLRSKNANDFKEIINMIKINKINELKRLNKNWINFEILVDMVKDPVDLESFIMNCLPELKKEINNVLLKADDRLSDLHKA